MFVMPAFAAAPGADAAGLVKGVWLASLIVLCMAAALSGTAQARGFENCNNGNVVTIGLPDRHRGLAASGRDDVCPAFAFGNDYQVLDWLETGKIDAAVVSPFVVEMFERGEKPLSDYLGVSKTWPLRRIANAASPDIDGPLPGYRVEAQVLGPEGALPDFEKAYDRIIKALADDDAITGKAKVRIVVDSYLAAALPLLLDYTEARLSVLGVDTRNNKRSFWKGLLQHVDLRANTPEATEDDGLRVVVRSVPDSTTPRDAPSVFLLSGDNLLQDVFAHSKSLHDLLYPALTDDGGTTMHWRAGTISAWLRDHRGVAGTDPDLFDIFDNNYSVYEAGFRTHRHFRFKLGELWEVLGRLRQADDQFALILTGGGVKAAYQTKLIDHLYGQAYLSNSGTRTPSADGKPILVDHVIGTSGGALLGTFVANIENVDDAGSLAEVVWRNSEGEYIGNFDVFPFFEMPRYLTFIVAGMFFVLLMYLLRLSKTMRKWTQPKTLPPALPTDEQTRRYLPPTLAWTTLLIVSPWIIKFVNGDKGLEHVPAIAGLFYFLCVLAAVVSDNWLIFRPDFKWRYLPFRGITLLLLIAGLVLAFIPTVAQFTTSFEAFLDLGEITLATLLCLCGILSVFVALYLALAASDDVDKVEGQVVFKAFTVLFLIPVFATLLVWVSGKSLVELSFEFWKYFSLWILVATVALILIAHTWRRDNPGKNFIKVGFDFLVSNYPAPGFMRKEKRYLRIVGFAAFGFFYWNLVMAPAIYGNEQAKNHFEYTYAKVFCESGTAQTDCDMTQTPGSPPGTNFVVSATSLEKKRERYFVFPPERFSQATRAVRVSSADKPMEELLMRDPRWIEAGPEVTRQELVDVVFASGSPFPVFPATQAGLSGYREWLVDGGYAHNVPIEAANSLGARTVLVISSSPLHQHATPDSGTGKGGPFVKLSLLIKEKLPGNLIHNVPRLFPYLFERSQIEDALSAEEMLVASISPRARDWWPSLIEFDSKVVRNLLKAADEDRDARIGMVESWGPPSCEFNGVAYGCGELKAIVSSAGGAR